jgi:hypothetical protein
MKDRCVKCIDHYHKSAILTVDCLDLIFKDKVNIEYPSMPPANNVVLCSLCNREIVPGDQETTTQCHHTFHAQCISNWLVNHTTCPRCDVYILVTARVDLRPLRQRIAEGSLVARYSL